MNFNRLFLVGLLFLFFASLAFATPVQVCGGTILNKGQSMDANSQYSVRFVDIYSSGATMRVNKNGNFLTYLSVPLGSSKDVHDNSATINVQVCGGNKAEGWAEAKATVSEQGSTASASDSGSGSSGSGSTGGSGSSGSGSSSTGSSSGSTGGSSGSSSGSSSASSGSGGSSGTTSGTTSGSSTSSTNSASSSPTTLTPTCGGTVLSSTGERVDAGNGYTAQFGGVYSTGTVFSIRKDGVFRTYVTVPSGSSKEVTDGDFKITVQVCAADRAIGAVEVKASSVASTGSSGSGSTGGSGSSGSGSSSTGSSSGSTGGSSDSSSGSSSATSNSGATPVQVCGGTILNKGQSMDANSQYSVRFVDIYSSGATMRVNKNGNFLTYVSVPLGSSKDVHDNSATINVQVCGGNKAGGWAEAKASVSEQGSTTSANSTATSGNTTNSTTTTGNSTASDNSTVTGNSSTGNTTGNSTTTDNNTTVIGNTTTSGNTTTNTTVTGNSTTSNNTTVTGNSSTGNTTNTSVVGNSSNSSNDTVIVPGISLSMQPGWNIFSVPIDGIVKASDTSGTCGGFGYRNTFTYVKSGSRLVAETSASFRAGNAYVFYAPTSCTVTINKARSGANRTFSFTSGWNVYTVASTKEFNNSTCGAVNGPLEYVGKAWKKVTVLEPFKAYFVRTSGSCTLN